MLWESDEEVMRRMRIQGGGDAREELGVSGKNRECRGGERGIKKERVLGRRC